MKAVDKIAEFNKFGSVLGLERMEELMKRLGNPEKSLKVLHVAGTNGKGSVCRFLCSVLTEAGYSTGIYSSPFLEFFNERIELNGQMISDEDLEKYTKVVVKASDEMISDGFDSPTEFEIVTAIAFLYFAKKNADYVILEVGLGGRGDSTNIIEKPLAAIITSISLDHTDRLGATISKIAYEKAGIIKKDVPVISGADNLEANEVISKVAATNNAKIFLSDDSIYEIRKETIDFTVFDAIVLGESYKSVKIPLLGTHQVRNALLALMTLEYLRKNQFIEITKEDIYIGISKTFHKGRFEVISKKPLIILDGGHNEAGAKSLTDTVNLLLKDKKILQLVGVLADKDIKNIIGNLIRIGNDFVITEVDNPRAESLECLEAILLERDAKVLGKAKNVDDGLKIALELVPKYDVLIISGSLYLVGHVRRLLRSIMEIR